MGFFSKIKGVTHNVEEAGDIVAAGQPILTFDGEAIKAAGHDDVVTCVVSNPQDFDSIELTGSSNTLLGGRPLVKVGDPLMVTKWPPRPNVRADMRVQSGAHDNDSDRPRPEGPESPLGRGPFMRRRSPSRAPPPGHATTYTTR